MKLVRVVVTACVVLAACGVRPPPEAPTRQTNLELSIQQSRLTNGLRVVLVQDPRAREVQVTMRYRVGGVDDPAGQYGVAHVVEHLMFQQVVGAQTVFAKLQGAATEFNATTTHEATTYVARGPVASLEALLAVEAIRLGFRCTSISDGVFLREREVVQNERRQRADQRAVVTALEQAIFPEGHPYHHPTIGTEESLAALTRQQACAFADAHYAPSNAVLVVSGNVTNEQAAAALAKFITKLPARAATAGVIAVPTPAGGRRVSVKSPLVDPALLVAWAVPADPMARTQHAVVFGMIADAVDARVGGQVRRMMLGDERAPQLALLISQPDDAQGDDDVLRAVQAGLGAVPGALRMTDQLSMIELNASRQGAIHQQFAIYEDAGKRDARIAAHVLAGGDPHALIAAELTALRELTPSTAADIALGDFAFDRATVVTLTPDEAALAAPDVITAPVVHDRGQLYGDTDPTAASRPADGPPPEPTRLLPPVSVTTLPNGMRVVLLPVTSVPTVDIRLVFSVGSGDDSPIKHGAALLAGYGLQIDLRHLNDYLAFAEGGGDLAVSVQPDRTVFAVRGLDMHLDYLLAGLRRVVRDGRYGAGTTAVARTLRDAAKDQPADDDDALADAWRVARFGARHPYVTAGVVGQISPLLTIDDASAFRDRYFVPSRATLVIAGKFDAALAAKWVKYLFEDWPAPQSSVARSTAPGTLTPVSLAADADGSQITVALAFPGAAGTRAARLVGEQMLAAVVADVRHQLGASYGLHARFDERRLATNYVVDGNIVASRTGEALALIQGRLDVLRTDPDARARAFVVARKRAIAKLTAPAVTSSDLSHSVEVDVTLGREPLSDRTTAGDVHALTVAKIAPVLSDLDLARAAISLRGPGAEVDAAYAAIGRTATRVAAAANQPRLTFTAADTRVDEPRIGPSEIEDALTVQPAASAYQIAVLPQVTAGAIVGNSLTGVGVAIEAGMRVNTSLVGVRLSVASASGTYERGPVVQPDVHDISILPLGAQLFAHQSWGFVQAAVFGGMHMSRFDDEFTPEPAQWKAAVALGVEANFEFARFGRHGLGVCVGVEAELFSGWQYSQAFAGLRYRLGVGD